MDLTINNGLITVDLFDSIDEEPAKAPLILAELNRRFKNELSYKLEIKDESRNLYILCLVGYRVAYAKNGEKLIYRAKGNLIYDGENLLEDGCLSGKLETSEKIEFTSYKDINYRKMVRVINKMDLPMYLDGDVEEENLPDKEPYIDMVDFAFDVELKLES